MSLSRILLCSSPGSRRLKLIAISGLLSLVFLNSWIAKASANDLEGTWVGVMEYGGKTGDAKIVITKAGNLYTATYRGLPSYSGKLYNVRYQRGKRPNTMMLTMTSRTIYKKATQTESVLRFYLLREPGKPQLFGVITLDLEVAKDIDFRAVFERQPCCDPKCIHPGKSSCPE